MYVFIYLTYICVYHIHFYIYLPNSIWMKNSERNTQHELRNANEYQIPLAKLSFFTRFPLYTLPKTWNNAGIVTCYSNPTTFKIALNEELLLGNEINRIQIPLPPPSPPPPPSNPPNHTS